VRAVSVLIDFSNLDAPAHAPRLKPLAELAENLKLPRLNVIAASRAAPGFATARSFVVGAEADEEARVVVGRARAIDESRASDSRSIDAGVEANALEAEEVLPFHPEAIAMVLALADAERRIASAAGLARGFDRVARQGACERSHLAGRSDAV
jgi:hypothetical protein